MIVYLWGMMRWVFSIFLNNVINIIQKIRYYINFIKIIWICILKSNIVILMNTDPYIV